MEIERPGESGGSIPLSAAEQSSRGPCVGRWVTQSCRWKIWEQVKTASTSVGRKKECGRGSAKTLREYGRGARDPARPEERGRQGQQDQTGCGR